MPLRAAVWACWSPNSSTTKRSSASSARSCPAPGRHTFARPRRRPRLQSQTRASRGIAVPICRTRIARFSPVPYRRGWRETPCRARAVRRWARVPAGARESVGLGPTSCLMSDGRYGRRGSPPGRLQSQLADHPAAHQPASGVSWKPLPLRSPVPFASQAPRRSHHRAAGLSRRSEHQTETGCPSLPTRSARDISSAKLRPLPNTRGRMAHHHSTAWTEISLTCSTVQQGLAKPRQ